MNNLKGLTGLNLWIACCDIDEDVELIELESKDDDSGLFCTKRRYLICDKYYYETTYHVYHHNKRIVSYTDYKSAYDVWKNCLSNQ